MGPAAAMDRPALVGTHMRYRQANLAHPDVRHAIGSVGQLLMRFVIILKNQHGMGGELETPGPGQGWTSLKECLSAVQRAVAARVGGQHSAPDLVQEAYARMLDRPAAASLVNLPGYLYRAALNIAYNGSARNSVENRVHGQLALSGDEASAALDPARICADRQALGRVMAAIDALPPRCREVFVLYRFEGLAQAEIAARLGISRNMVEKHVIRAMGACRAALNEERPVA